jgi:hypothetical protein
LVDAEACAKQIARTAWVEVNADLPDDARHRLAALLEPFGA